MNLADVEARAYRAAMPPAEPATIRDLRKALIAARWYVQDHMESQPNDEARRDLAMIDAALATHD